MSVLHLLCAGAAKGLVQALQPEFTAASEAKVRWDFGAVGAMREKLIAGALCDMIVLTAAAIDALAAEKRVKPESVATLGGVATGIAVPADSEWPEISDADSLRRALARARAIYLPDPERATAGIHFVNVLRTLGIHDEVRQRLRPFPNGATAMRAMADAGEPDLIGCTQVTEILYTAGVALVDVLPAEFALITAYSVAICTEAAEPELARQFAALLTRAESVALRRAGGFVV